MTGAEIFRLVLAAGLGVWLGWLIGWTRGYRQHGRDFRLSQVALLPRAQSKNGDDRP